MGFRARVKSKGGKTYIRYFVKETNYNKAIAAGAQPYTPRAGSKKKRSGRTAKASPAIRNMLSGPGKSFGKKGRASVALKDRLTKPGKGMTTLKGGRRTSLAKSKDVRKDQAEAVKRGATQKKAGATQKKAPARKQNQPVPEKAQKIREIRSKMKDAAQKLRQMKKDGKRITTKVALVQKYLAWKKEIKALR